MVPDEFFPSAKLVDMWRAGLVESIRLARGPISARAAEDISSQALREEIANIIYSTAIAEFRFVRVYVPKVRPLFGENSLWVNIAKGIDHTLPMCDVEAAKFVKLLERELQAFFLDGKTWEASWGKVCVDDGDVVVRLTAKVKEHHEPGRKTILKIDL
jgi:hypothetical protein